MKKLKPLSPPNVRTHLSARYTAEEKKRLRELAEEWTAGNVSEWIRIASLKFRPRKEDLASGE